MLFLTVTMILLFSFLVHQEEDDVHIYFEPVVELPEMVDVKTGEEEETALFEAHAKLFQFVGLDWKERGVGVMMILRHDVTGKVRLLMRRDQVGCGIFCCTVYFILQWAGFVVSLMMISS